MYFQFKFVLVMFEMTIYFSKNALLDTLQWLLREVYISNRAVSEVFYFQVIQVDDGRLSPDISSLKPAQSRGKWYDSIREPEVASITQDHNPQLIAASHVWQSDPMVPRLPISSNIKVHQVWKGTVQFNIVKDIVAV